MSYGAHEDWYEEASAEAMGDMVRLMEAMLNGANLDFALDALASMVERQASGSRCLLALADTVERRLRLSRSPHLPLELLLELEDLPFGAQGGGFGLAAEQRQTITSGDIAQDSAWSGIAASLTSNGLQAGMALPVLTEGNDVLGVVSLLFRDQHLPSPREQFVARRAARLARLVIQYEQRQQVLQRNARLYHDMVESLPVPTFILRGERPSFVNGALSELTGYAADALFTTPLWDLADADDTSTMREVLIANQRGSQHTENYRFRLRTKSGAVRPIELRTRPVRFNGGEALLGVMLDRDDG